MIAGILPGKGIAEPAATAPAIALAVSIAICASANAF